MIIGLLTDISRGKIEIIRLDSVLVSVYVVEKFVVRTPRHTVGDTNIRQSFSDGAVEIHRV